MQRHFDTLRQASTPLLILLVGLLGGWAVYYATENGPWGFSDSVSYIVSARNLIRGSGLGLFYPDGSFHWETHFPPFYSLLLALFAAPGLDLVSTARWVSLVLFVLTILGAGLLIYRFGGSRLLAVAAAGLVAVFPTMLNMFSAAMSEPLFICLAVWSIYVLLLYFENGRPVWFVAAGLLTGLLPLTRYVGVGLPAVMALAVLLFQPGDWRRRLIRAVQFALLSGWMILAWLAWVSTRVDSTVGGRAVLLLSWERFFMAVKYLYAALIRVLWGWLPFGEALPALTGNIKLVLMLLAAGLVLFLTLRARRASEGQQSPFRVFGLSALFVVGYLATLLAACVFTTPRPDIDDRMLLPVYLAFVLALLSAFSTWRSLLRGPLRLGAGTAVLILVALLVWSDVAQDLPLLPRLRNNLTMTASRWRDAPIMRAVRALPPRATLISSASTEILIWADRPSYDFVETLGTAILDASGPYGSDPSNPVQAIFRKKGSILIIFTGVRPQIDRLYGEKGDARLDSLLSGLDVYADFSNGTFYTYPASKRPKP